MTMDRLVCACYNVFPVVTKIKVMDNHGKELYLGVWSYGAIKDFGDLTVLYFKIDEINKKRRRKDADRMDDKGGHHP